MIQTPANNTFTVSQKGKLCGEIRMHVKTSAGLITPALRGLAAKLLLADPQHQKSYFDMLLVDSAGRELDFETDIL